MARYALIDGYLDTMRTEIHGRRDLDDVVCEMEDHLYSAVEGLLARGLEPDAAQRTTLDRFGEPKALAAVYASTNTGGIAVPTTTTKLAGTAAYFSAALWIVGLIGFWASAVSPDRPSSIAPDALILDAQTITWMSFALASLAAGAIMLFVMVGVNQRHGGLGSMGMAGLIVTGLGVLATLVIWAVVLWLGLMALGLITFAVAVLRRGIAPRFWTIVWAGGPAVGATAFLALRWLEVGTPDVWGDYWIASSVGLNTGIIIMTIGLIGLGTWLRSEEPVDADTPALAV
ncbi:MAG: hypothetical protein HKO03_06740 [Acidimicrobiia bacterium]|nr:hypothetical protein [Acidimicrobiia bacterium]